MNIEEKVVKKLNEKNMLLTTAESCTAGMIASAIVNVSGASNVFHQGYITYCDEAKNSMLNVKKETLKLYTAVSPQTACEMALGALQSIEAAGRTVGEDIYLVGVDALSEALEDVLAGTMTGTVFNDHFSQSHSAADAAINYLNGTGNEHYIGCDYVKVTKDNAQEILDMVKPENP